MSSSGEPDLRSQAVRRALAHAVAPWTPAYRRWSRVIEARRRALCRQGGRVNTRLAHQPPHERPLGEVVRAVAKRPGWGRFLMTLAAELPVEYAVELGTSVGISASYLGAGLCAAGRGRLTTMEGVEDIAAVARATVDAVGVGDRVEVVTGTFTDRLSEVLAASGAVQLVFVDGHHEHDATLGYLELLRPALGPGSLVVFDDVRWSDGMRAAWRTIRSRPDTGFARDLGRVGLWGPAR